MKKLAVYAAAAAATMSIATTIPASAAVKMYVVNGNFNGTANGNGNSTCFGGGNQNMDLSDVLSSLCPNLPMSFPSYGNQAPEMDILRPNLPDKGCLYPEQIYQPDFSCPGQNISDSDCWWSCPDQSYPDFSCPDQNQPDQNCPGINCPDQNQPGQPGQPGQPNQPSQPGQPGQPNQPSQPNQRSQPNQPVNPPSQGGTTNTTYAQQVINMVNEERAKAGLSPVQQADSITQAANVRAREIVTNFSHTRPDGSSFSTALRQAGVSYMGSGENIAYGQRTPQEVMDGWMNSAGHRANILNPNYKNIGIGFYETNGVKYWVQLFTY